MTHSNPIPYSPTNTRNGSKGHAKANRNMDGYRHPHTAQQQAPPYASGPSGPMPPYQHQQYQQQQQYPQYGQYPSPPQSTGQWYPGQNAAIVATPPTPVPNPQYQLPQQQQPLRHYHQGPGYHSLAQPPLQPQYQQQPYRTPASPHPQQNYPMQSVQHQQHTQGPAPHTLHQQQPLQHCAPQSQQQLQLHSNGAEQDKVDATRFKTKMCRSYSRMGSCPYDVRCMFAHGPQELRTPDMNVRDGLVTEEAIRKFRAQYYGKQRPNHEDFTLLPSMSDPQQLQSKYAGSAIRLAVVESTTESAPETATATAMQSTSSMLPDAVMTPVVEPLTTSNSNRFKSCSSLDSHSDEASTSSNAFCHDPYAQKTNYKWYEDEKDAAFAQQRLTSPTLSGSGRSTV